MAKESEIVPKKMSIRDLLSTHYFKVPYFQRGYSWKLENWDDFWNDLTSHIDKDHDFFIGSIVTKNLKKDASYEIIDGQQRVATSIIFLAAIRDYFNRNSNDLGKEIQSYISKKEVLRKSKSKLSLSKEDDKFFQEYIINEDTKIDLVKNRGLKQGERLIWKCYKFFEEKIKGTPSNLKKILSNLLDSTYLIIIQVENDMQAYTVFETLNARGIDLTAADLIKNYVLSKAVEESVLNPLLQSWDRLSRNLENYSVTLFIKYYLTTLIGEPIREKDIFKKIKDAEYAENNVEEFVSSLENNSESYLSLLEPKENYWQDKEIPSILNNIKIMRLKTCYPMLLAINNSKFKDSIKKELFREVENLGFRYSIIMNNNPNKLEVKYAAWAELINNKNIEIQKLKQEIRKIKPSDKDFFDRFIQKNITENNISNYIISKIGIKAMGEDLLSISNSATVEHVLPQKPEKWIDYIKEHNSIKLHGETVDIKEFVEEITYRLGNQTLLLQEDNSKLGNESFETKKEKVFMKSKFILNQKISKEKIWSIIEIEKHQKEMGEIALKIW